VGSQLVKILVIGAAGMIGRKLVERLAGELILHDVVQPAARDGARTVVSDLSAPGVAEALVADRPGLIFHLAAVVSGEAEAEFEKGYRVNLDGTRRLFEAIRKAGDVPLHLLADHPLRRHAERDAGADEGGDLGQTDP
jgi:nucleoside-diphosphate-sugar epimerase